MDLAMPMVTTVEVLGGHQVAIMNPPLIVGY